MSELPVEDLLSVDEALRILDAAEVFPRQVERLLSDPALPGLHLAEEIRADRDYPPFDKSLVDGFAMRAADEGARRVMGLVAAGERPPILAAAGECVAIMTGAPLPPGFDSVVPIEQTDTTTFDTPQVRPHEAPVAGRYLARQGSEVRSGQIVLPAGTRITASVIGVLATVGVARVRVIDRPQVGILTTGDEIVGVEGPAGPSHIRNSNGPQLLSLVRSLGGEAVARGHAADEPQQIRQAIAGARVDLLLITGGMSMGAHDYVPHTLKELGYDLRVTKLRIKPGKPFIFAARAETASPDLPQYIFGLPGNPVSGFVCTLRFVGRLIRRLQRLSPEPAWRTITLQESLPANGPREFYQPILLDGDRCQVLSWKGSADVFTLAKANALLVRRADEGPRHAGEAALAMEIPL